jgi:hypothetical protein
MSTLRVNNIDNLGLDDVITNGVVEKRALPSGSVLQVVSTTKTNIFSMTSTTFADVTDFSAAITPSSTSSKILITGSINVSTNGTSNAAMWKILRDSTDIAVGDAAGSRIRAYSGGEFGTSAVMPSQAFNFLDSPNTTSATTYKIQIRSNTSGQAAQVNYWVSDTDAATRVRGVSTITLMEIAG